MAARFGPFMASNEVGHLEIDGCDSVRLSEEFGTPLWVISERTIRRNLRELRDAFARVYPRTRIAYASKANPEPAVSRVARLEGALVDVVTMGHVCLVLAAGFRPDEIIFNGNSKTLEELRWALARGVRAVNVDSLEEMEAIARLQPHNARPVSVCLRLAVDERRFADDPEFAAHWQGAKFGMDEPDALAAADVASEHPAIRVEGLHHHFGWPVYGTPYEPELDLARHVRSLEQVLDFAALLEGTRGLSARVLNLGGGFRRARPEGFGPGAIDRAPSAQDYAETIAGKLAEAARGVDGEPPELVLEPGGYLVADAVVLLATVGFGKRRRSGEGTRRWAFLENTSAYHFVRRLMFGFHHHVVAANRLDDAATETVSVAGPICADDDVALDARLPPLARGDLLAVLDQGAYCESVTSDYCVVPIPPAVLVSAGRAELVRRRETVDDIGARFTVPSWLEVAQPVEEALTDTVLAERG